MNSRSERIVNNMTVKQLRSYLKKNKIDTSGRKALLKEKVMKIIDQKQGNLRRENTQEELSENSESSCQSDIDDSSVSLDRHRPPKKRVREILDEQSESSYKSDTDESSYESDTDDSSHDSDVDNSSKKSDTDDSSHNNDTDDSSKKSDTDDSFVIKKQVVQETINDIESEEDPARIHITIYLQSECR